MVLIKKVVFKITNEYLKKNDILYKPNIDYDKNYNTIAYNNENNINKDFKNEKTQLDELKDDMKKIYSLLTMLPNDISDSVKETLVVVKSITGDIKDINEKPKDIEEIVDIIVSDKNDNDKEYPDSFFTDDEDEPFIIKINKKDNITIIKENYNYDITSIFKDYIHNLKTIITNYIESILDSFKNIDSKNINKALTEYNGNTKNVSQNYKHLSDFIIRSQISRKFKTKFYNKKFNVDNSISHIKLCKAGIEQRIRYYEEEYLPSINYENAISNKVLENCRFTYDNKYKENFINLYKYLNSSIELLKECLKMHSNEIQMKCILLKKEGNDLW